MPFSLDLILKVGPLIETFVIAAAATWVSVNQWRISKEKLRLDLYNRRFAVYLRVLEFYQELLEWQDKEYQIALKKPFVQAVRESRFVFPANSGVLVFLEEFERRAFYIVTFKEVNQAMQGMSDERMKCAQEKLDHSKWILNSMATLEDKMAPYLNFRIL